MSVDNRQPSRRRFRAAWTGARHGGRRRACRRSRPRASSPTAPACRSSTSPLPASRRRRRSSSRSPCSSGSERSRTRSTRTRSGRAHRSRQRQRRSTSYGSRRAHTVQFAVAPREDVMLEIRRLSRANDAFARVLDDDLRTGRRLRPTTSKQRTGSPTGRSSGSSTRSSSRRPRTARATSTSSRKRMRCSSASASTASCASPSASRGSSLSGVVTRLKVLAKLDIAERRKPQDGRISLDAAAAGRLLDVRVATLPTVEGESVTMRLLDKSRDGADARRARLSTRPCVRRSTTSSSKPTGALLVTGPTGSGKSTSLYAALAELNRPEINVITVEDPVEYRLAGIDQVQINPRAGLTFSTALRSILRSDPDVVMVGEIRDVETAKISIESALTGHFVLSTLHTNDAPADHHAPERDGSRAVPDRFGDLRRARAAAAAEALHELLPRSTSRATRTCAPRVCPSTSGTSYKQHDLPARRGLPPVLEHRLSGSRRHLPAAADERRARVSRRIGRESRPHRARCRRGRYAPALGGRPGESARGRHLGRRARTRPRLRTSSRFATLRADVTGRRKNSPIVGVVRSRDAGDKEKANVVFQGESHESSAARASLRARASRSSNSWS